MKTEFSRDMIVISRALEDEMVRRYGLIVEWLASYVSFRKDGMTPEEASDAAYYEWDV